MRCFKFTFLMLITLSCASTFAQDDVEVLVDVSLQNTEKAKETISFNPNDAPPVHTGDITEYLPNKVQDEHFNGSGELWDALAEANASAAKMNTKDTRYGDDVKAFVMISMSIPEQSLQRLFIEAAYQYPDEEIIFVFQGFTPQKLNELVSQVHRHIPDGAEVAVVVDPTFFDTLEVDEVPFFAVSTDSGWKKVLGDVSIFNAIEEAENHYATVAPIGKTYPIIEPNILHYIYDKIEQVDWNAQIENATQELVNRREGVVCHRQCKTDPLTTI